MTLRNIFNTYFKKKLFFCLTIAIIVSVIRYFNKGDITIQMLSVVLLVTLGIAFAIGWTDYSFYEKKLPRLISSLLDRSPLNEFSVVNNFIIENQDKLVGHINGYRITLSPLVNNSSEKYLTILIPLELRNGLDNYFENGLDDKFRLYISENILFTEAVLIDYDKKYDHNKLYDLLNTTTHNLKEKKVLPLKVYDE